MDAWGFTDVMGMVGNAVVTAHYLHFETIPTIGNGYARSFYYYIPTQNDTVVKINVWATCDWGEGKAVRVNEVGTWTQYKVSNVAINNTVTRFTMNNSASSSTISAWNDSLYFKDFQIHQISALRGIGNHSVDSSSTYKQSGSYSGKITASAAGDGSTNTTSLASTKFTAVTRGTSYRFKVYAYTTTADVTLTFLLGDISVPLVVSTVGMAELDFDFTATASTTGAIYLYLDKAATVYLDNETLRAAD